MLKSVGIGSTTIYVDNIRPFFNSQVEDATSLTFQNKVTLVSQDTKTGAAATAIVSGLGTISSISISSGGVGYSTTPTVSMEILHNLLDLEQLLSQPHLSPLGL